MGRPLILFFNQFFTETQQTDFLECRAECEFTHDRARFAEADAVVIHLPACPKIWEARKYPGQLWVAWCLESDVTVPALRDPRFMRHFDLTMTYRRDADAWWPYLPPLGFPPSPTTGLMTPMAAKTERAPAVLFQSASYDRSGRNAFAFELMKKVRVDSYGRFLTNRKLREPDRGPATKLAVISRYKFCLAFENSRTVDYVTEKFFHPLMAGSVPVYRGAPNIADFAPGEKSYIDADDFTGPGELAEYLNHLDGDDAAYREYFRWKSADFSPGFQAMIDRLQRHPLCSLCEIVARQSRTRHRLPAAERSFVRPLFLHQWYPRGVIQQARLARHAIARRLQRRQQSPRP